MDKPWYRECQFCGVRSHCRLEYSTELWKYGVIEDRRAEVCNACWHRMREPYEKARRNARARRVREKKALEQLESQMLFADVEIHCSVDPICLELMDEWSERNLLSSLGPGPLIQADRR